MNIDKVLPRNTKDQPHGYWEIYRSDGYLMYKCIYNNGKVIGYQEIYNYYNYNKLNSRYHL